MIEKITPDAINPDKFDKLIISLRTAPPIADKLNAISNNGNGNDNDNRNGHNNHGERDDDYYLNLNKDPRISLYRTFLFISAMKQTDTVMLAICIALGVMLVIAFVCIPAALAVNQANNKVPFNSPAREKISREGRTHSGILLPCDPNQIPACI
jgi:hypothetical protein